jgi:hypothetical protein
MMFPALYALAWLTSLNIGAAQDAILGPEIRSGERVSFHFWVTSEDGREFANTERRGLPFSVVAGGPIEPWFSSQLVGFHVGESRTIRLEAGVLPFVPLSTPVQVRIQALAIEKN